MHQAASTSASSQSARTGLQHGTTLQSEILATPLPAHSLLSAPDGITIASLSIQLARTDAQRSAASRLVDRRYAWRGYRSGPGPADALSATLLACWGKRVAGTLTIGLDAPAGLACAQLYPEQVARLRARGARLCEFTRLAVDDARHSTEILAGLSHIAFIYARQLHDATDLLIEVNPRHAAYYQRLLGFEQAGPLRTCPRVDAPAVLLRLPLARAATRLETPGPRAAAPAAGAHSPDRADSPAPRSPDRARSLYAHCFSPPEMQRIANRLRAFSPPLAFS